MITSPKGGYQHIPSPWTQIRLTSPKISKPDNLFCDKITQPLEYAQLIKLTCTPPKGSKPNHLYISQVTEARPSIHLPSY